MTFQLPLPCLMFSHHTNLGPAPDTLAMHPLTVTVDDDECLVLFSSHDKLMAYIQHKKLKGPVSPIETRENLIGVLRESPYPKVALDPDAQTGSARIWSVYSLIRDLTLPPQNNN